MQIRIRDTESFWPWIQDPVPRMEKIRIRDPDPQHCKFGVFLPYRDIGGGVWQVHRDQRGMAPADC
jgi:hypothetical protein